MAFVYRSDRDTSLSPNKKENYEIGPGQYVSQSQYEPAKTSKVPFIFKTAREDKKYNPEEDLPGPGSYYKDETMEKYFKNIQREKRMNEETQNSMKLLNNLHQFATSDGFTCVVMKKDAEHLGFLTKDKRFKEIKEKNQTPGPGNYLKVIEEKNSPNFNERKEILFGKISKSDITKMDKVSSIPGKNQVFGYEMKEDGVTYLNEDPESYKKFKGIKDDMVGPGNYNVIKAENWLKKGQHWAKSTARVKPHKRVSSTFNRLSNFNKLSKSFENELIADDNLFKIENTRSKTAKFTKKESNNILKNNNKRKINRKYLYDEMINKNQPADVLLDKFNRNLTVDLPGPGYYYDPKKQSSFQPKKNPESKQNFQSNLRRFPEAPTTLNEQIGPGSYFKDENKFNERKSKKMIPIMRDIKSATVEKTNNETPGPGQYNPLKEMRKTFTNHFSFGSTEKRFIETGEIKTPGPGSYLETQTTQMNTIFNNTGMKWNQNKNDLKLIRRAVTSKIRVYAQSKIPDPFDKKEIPPVGTYNPDTIFSIDYKVKKNVNKMTNVDIPFYSTLPKKAFFENRRDLNPKIGPGYYYKEKKPQTAQVYPPFKHNETRFFQHKNEVNIGPGNYNQNSYFDWNKKSFNILYL